MCEMKKLLKFLKKFGLIKAPHESMQEFLLRSQTTIDIDLQNINRLYHQLKYTKNIDVVAFDSLKQEIKKLM